jgi:hypothetical protein
MGVRISQTPVGVPCEFQIRYCQINWPKLVESLDEDIQAPPIPPEVLSQLPGASVEVFQPGWVEERWLNAYHGKLQIIQRGAYIEPPRNFTGR